MMRCTPGRVMTETSCATSIGSPLCTRPPTPEYSPSEFSRTITQSNSGPETWRSGLVMPGKIRVGRMFGVLVERLADGQAQAPEGDIIGDVRRTDGAEQDGVELAELLGAVGRHHHAMLAVIVRTPVEVVEAQSEAAIALGADLQDLHAGLNHLGPDAITAHGSDLIRTHVFLLVGADPPGCNSRRSLSARESAARPS